MLSVWLTEKLGRGVTVISFEEELYQGGGCETCYYESLEVHLSYRDPGKIRLQTYEHYGNLAEIITELSEIEV